MKDELAGMPVCGEVVPPGRQLASAERILAQAKDLLSEWEEEARESGGKMITLRPELVIYDLLKVVGLVDDASLKKVFGKKGRLQGIEK